MTDVEALLASIAGAPAGPSTAAFFDLDGTVIEGFTAEVVYRDRLRRLDVGLGELGRSTLAALDMRFRGATLDKLVNVAFEGLAGRMEDELDELGERLFRHNIASRLYPRAPNSSKRTARPATGWCSRPPRRRSRPNRSAPTWASTPSCARARRCRPGCSWASWTATSYEVPARLVRSSPTRRARACG